MSDDRSSKAGVMPVLVIGATCVDVLIRLDKLPVRGGHCRVLGQKISLGGCAYNVADIISRCGVPFRFITPVGTGFYGDFVEKGLKERGFRADIRITDENGCCYCLVEPDGERSFIPYHGGEYAFRKEWMKDVDPADYGYVYVGGIEINEPTGEDIVSWLEEVSSTGAGPQIFFAPSPHIGEIKPGLVTRLLSLHPILHMNADESIVMSGKEDVSEAALSLRDMTGNAVIITLGADGALCLEKEGRPYIVPVRKCEVVDTTGAGDAHAGAFLAALAKSLSMRGAVAFANETAAAITEVTGASFSDDRAL